MKTIGMVGVLIALLATAALAATTIKGSKSNYSFRQAFVPCTAPNTTTEDGLPACTPPRTFNEQAGNPPNGWLGGAGTSAQLQMKSGMNKTVNPLNPPDSADVAIGLKMKGVHDSTGLATSTGALSLVVRISFDDRVGGNMTLVDRPLNVPISVVGGTANIKTSINAVLNSSALHGLPSTFTMEVVSSSILDPNGNPIGVPAVALGPGCNPSDCSPACNPPFSNCERVGGVCECVTDPCTQCVCPAGFPCF